MIRIKHRRLDAVREAELDSRHYTVRVPFGLDLCEVHGRRQTQLLKVIFNRPPEVVAAGRKALS